MSRTRFGPVLDPDPQDPLDLDLGPTFLNPMDPGRIWIQGLKTDLDPGPPGPGPDPTRCHPYLCVLHFYYIICLLLSSSKWGKLLTLEF